ELAGKFPAMIFTSVDLPAPLSPINPTISPESMVKLTPVSASIAPKCFAMLRSSSSAIAVSSRVAVGHQAARSSFPWAKVCQLFLYDENPFVVGDARAALIWSRSPASASACNQHGRPGGRHGRRTGKQDHLVFERRLR